MGVLRLHFPDELTSCSANTEKKLPRAKFKSDVRASSLELLTIQMNTNE